MEKQQPPSFSAYELAKMASLIADSMAKVEKVLERLQKTQERQNMMLLLQALDNLNHVYMKLLGYGRVKAKQTAKKNLERARKMLDGKTGGRKFQPLEF